MTAHSWEIPRRRTAGVVACQVKWRRWGGAFVSVLWSVLGLKWGWKERDGMKRRDLCPQTVLLVPVFIFSCEQGSLLTAVN